MVGQEIGFGHKGCVVSARKDAQLSEISKTVEGAGDPSAWERGYIYDFVLDVLSVLIRSSSSLERETARAARNPMWVFASRTFVFSLSDEHIA